MADKGAFTLGGYDEDELIRLGLGPMTPMSRSGRLGDVIKAPDHQNRRALQFGSGVNDVLGAFEAPARSFVRSAGDTQDAAREMYDDPSLTNLGILGQRAGGTIGHALPLTGLATQAAGFIPGALGSAGEDLGLFDGMAANAAEPITIPPLPGSKKQARMDDIREKAAAEALINRGAENETRVKIAEATARAKAEGQVRQEEARLAAAAKEAAAVADRERIGNSRKLASAARNREFARGESFADTEFADFLKRFGGTAPTIAGTGFGLLSALGTKALGGKALAQALSGFGGGTTAAWSVARAPQLYDASLTPIDNPIKSGLDQELRLMEQDDPRRAQVQADYDRQPALNPINQAANEHLADWQKQLKGLGTAAIEGGWGGAAALPAAYGVRSMLLGGAKLPGQAAGAAADSFKRAKLAAPVAPAPKPVEAVAPRKAIAPPPQTPVKTGASAGRAKPRAKVKADAPEQGKLDLGDAPSKTSTQLARAEAKKLRRDHASSILTALQKGKPVPKAPDWMPPNTKTKLLNHATAVKKAGGTQKDLSNRLDKAKLGVIGTAGAAGSVGLADQLRKRAEEKDGS